MNNNSENIKEWDKPLFETSFKETGNWHAKESREKVGEIIVGYVGYCFRLLI